MAEKKYYPENRVVLTGVLKDLEVKDFETKDKVPMKVANFSVQTGEGEVHRVTKMAVKYFKDKETNQDRENEQYKAIQTMEDEYITLANANTEEGQRATVVRVTGQLELNVYKGRNGIQEVPQVNARYVSRLDTYTEEDFGAEFVIHGFVLGQPKEILNKDEEPTGEVEFKVAFIDYKEQAHPFTVKANNEYGVAEWALDELKTGATTTISGIILNKYIVEKVERPNPAGVGKPIVDINRTEDRRILVEGITPIEDEEDIKFIDSEKQRKALEKYEQHKVEVNSRERKTVSPNAQKGVQSSKGVQTAASKPAPSKAISSDDLPF